MKMFLAICRNLRSNCTLTYGFVMSEMSLLEIVKKHPNKKQTYKLNPKEPVFS